MLKAFELAQKSQAEKKEHLEAVEKAYAKEKKKNVDREGELAQLEEKETALKQELEAAEAQGKVWMEKLEALRKKTWENTKELEEEDEKEEKEEAMEVEEDPYKRVIPDAEEEQLAQVDKARIERNIIRLEAERENLKKNVNLSTIAE